MNDLSVLVCCVCGTILFACVGFRLGEIWQQERDRQAEEQRARMAAHLSALWREAHDALVPHAALAAKERLAKEEAAANPVRHIRRRETNG